MNAAPRPPTYESFGLQKESVACATEGLKRLEQGDRLCAYANALLKDGERQAAHQAYLGVLAADPSSNCASAGVKATGSKTSVGPASAILRRMRGMRSRRSSWVCCC